jgi:hypothetical protein
MNLGEEECMYSYKSEKLMARRQDIKVVSDYSQGPVAASCDYSNEPFSSIKHGEFVWLRH